MRNRFTFLFIVLGFLISACAEESSSEEARVFLVTAEMDGENILVTLPDGRSFTELESYINEMPGIISNAVAQGYEIKFDFRPFASFKNDALTTGNGMETIEQPLRVNWNNYVFTVNFYISKTINGCVSRRCRPVVNVRKHEVDANGRGEQRWDWHAGVYFNGRSPCLGLYQSENPTWCRNSCFPGRRIAEIARQAFETIRGSIYESLLAVGVAAGAAWAIATMLAPIAAGALAF